MEHQAQDQPLVWTIDETIERARTSRATIYREIKSGRLKTVRIGRRRYVTPEAARAWIESLAEDSEAA